LFWVWSRSLRCGRHIVTARDRLTQLLEKYMRYGTAEMAADEVMADDWRRIQDADLEAMTKRACEFGDSECPHHRPYVEGLLAAAFPTERDVSDE
jgi:hypothetical protein